MDSQTDPEFLKNEAYDDAQALDTRNEIQRRFRSHPQSWFRWIFDRLDLRPDAMVLELGAGPGELWQRNLDRLQDGWRLYLTDLSAGMLQTARGLIPGANRPGCAVVNAQAVPFPAQVFDAVLAVGLLDHVPDRGQALQEIWRVLKAGGRFYATAGGKRHLHEFAELVHPFLPTADYGGEAENFGLENGARLLAPYFQEVGLEPYQDELVFDRPEPVIEYLFSEAAIQANMEPEARAALQQFVEHELAVRRELLVTVEKGLFSGVRGPQPE
jgi:ubiquinone/menaquinone biosynthesis C-methylase UbiE